MARRKERGRCGYVVGGSNNDEFFTTSFRQAVRHVDLLYKRGGARRVWISRECRIGAPLLCSLDATGGKIVCAGGGRRITRQRSA